MDQENPNRFRSFCLHVLPDKSMVPEKPSLHLETQHKDAIGERTEFLLRKLHKIIPSSSADERAGRPAQITGGRWSGRGPDYGASFFFCLYR